MFYHLKTDKEPTLDPDEAEDHKWVTLDEPKKIKNKEGAMTDFFKRNSHVNGLFLGLKRGLEDAKSMER
jgi:isopentenyldiphosphate isomerase